MNFQQYQTEGFFDELFEAPTKPRPGAQPLVDRIESLPPGDLLRRQKAAESSLLQMGITFNVYGHEAGTEKIWPFDMIPRVVPADDWSFLERGLRQRIEALNLFIDDIYNQQIIVRDGVIPESIIRTAK